MLLRTISTLVFILLFTLSSQAQETKITPYGNIRLAYVGNTDNLTGIGNSGDPDSDFFAVRIRYGMNIQLNEQSSFKARLAGQFRDYTDNLSFSLKADGGGLNHGTLSFDEFYYQNKNAFSTLKIGRFQHTVAILSNAQRSGFRFQSNSVNVHWSDGLYWKNKFTSEWYTELILESQPKNNTTYPYRSGLNFGNADHNITSYFGLENRTRDENNFIQKGFGVFVAPNAYQKGGDYTTYALVMSRAAVDIPRPGLLSGGSIRFAGELGQNLNNELSAGTNAIISAGINRYDNKHDFMIEFSRTDREWLTGTAYAAASEELEIRYKYYINNKLNMDARYRARHSDSSSDMIFSTFVRLTYSL
ncbi:MAG: hypothetical protein JJ895_04580 [Balneolaceae bacterium]|nr:hypothetical protein [Balneolaceae bacterium]